jgi:Phage tail lysozyme/Chaperone of endosialidase
MGGGGKGGSSSTTVSIPPEVLARYNAVNAQAQQLGGIDPTTGQPNTPYTPYTGEFVAPLNTVQNAAIGNINAAQGVAQPYYNAATQYTQQAAQAFQPLTQQQIQQYQNPFVQSVVDPTVKALQQQQGQQLSQQQTNAIRSGAFGGDRSGIERAVLEGQQNLALGQAISPLYSQAYQSGLAAAQQQQQVGGQGLMGAGAQLANLGAGAQNTALAGANAQLAAGTVGQQTQQALDTAKYQQFLQQQGYPFQLTQFLANIAEGTGALSGSTTSTTQASDERLKHDIKKIGTANDGLPIYSFKYKGDDQTRIGFMAQDVEKKIPEAVGVMGGYKTVDYDKVANENARDHRSYGGGVWEPGAYSFGGREHHAMGNSVGGQMNVDPTDWAALVQAHGQIANPYGIGAGNKAGTPGASGVVPAASLAVPKLLQASTPQLKQTSNLQDAVKTGQGIANLAQSGNDFKKWVKEQTASTPADKNTPSTKPDVASKTDTTSKADLPSPKAKDVSYDNPNGPQSGYNVPAGNSTPSADNLSQDIDTSRFEDMDFGFSYGGVVPRGHFGMGGDTDPYGLNQGTGEELPKDVVSASEASKDEAEKEAPKPGKTGGGGGDSTLSDIGTAASIVGTAAKIIPFFLASGGVVPREHHDGSTGKNDVGQTDTSDTSGGGGGSDSDTSQAPRSRQFMDYLTEKKGYNPNVAAAIVGNAYHESGGLNPTILGDNNNSYGLFQFNKNGEQPAFRQWAADNKRDIADPYAQLDFVHERLQGPYADTLKAMNNAPDAATAASHFMRGYERPKEGQTAGESARTSFADMLASGKALPDGMTGMGRIYNGPQQQQAQGTNRRNSSVGDVFGEMTPESVPTSSNFWVPLLSAIATAGASRAPTRGQALAEGVLGGVSAYQTQVEQQSRLAKQAFDIMNNTFVQGQDKAGYPTWFNKNTGQQTDAAGRAAYGAQLMTNFGLDPKKWGFSGTLPANQQVSSQPMTTLEGPVKQPQAEGKPANGAPAHAGVASDPKQQPMDVPDVNSMTESQLATWASKNKEKLGLTGDKDPDVLTADVNQLRRSAESALAMGRIDQYNADSALAQRKQELRDKYLQQAYGLVLEKNKAYVQDDTAAQKLQNEEVTKRANGYIGALQSYERIGDILSQYKTGNTEQAMQRLRGMAQALHVAPESWQKASNNFDELYKLTMTAALEDSQKNGFNRAPKATVTNELATQPGPTVNPAAAYALVGRQIGDLKYQMAEDQEWVKQPRDTRPVVFKQNFINGPKGNSEAYKGYVRDAFENHVAKPNDNITREELESLQKTYGNFTPKGLNKAPEQQQQQQQRSAVPPGTQVGQEMQFKQGVGVWNGTQWVPKGAQ